MPRGVYNRKPKPEPKSIEAQGPTPIDIAPGVIHEDSYATGVTEGRAAVLKELDFTADDAAQMVGILRYQLDPGLPHTKVIKRIAEKVKKAVELRGE